MLEFPKKRDLKMKEILIPDITAQFYRFFSTVSLQASRIGGYFWMDSRLENANDIPQMVTSYDNKKKLSQ